jgi:hypothetical protein
MGKASTDMLSFERLQTESFTCVDTARALKQLADGYFGIHVHSL